MNTKHTNLLDSGPEHLGILLTWLHLAGYDVSHERMEAYFGIEMTNLVMNLEERIFEI